MPTPTNKASADSELMQGSGNVFRDLGHPNPDLEQLRSLLAAEIIKTLDKGKLSVRDAEKQTGVPLCANDDETVTRREFTLEG